MKLKLKPKPKKPVKTKPTAKPKRKAVWAKGTYLTKKVPAQQAYNELNRIKNRNAGELTPANVLDEARNENSPIHPCFLWDDTEAAEKYRLTQARELIHSIRIITDPDSDNRTESVAFISTRTEEGRAYQDTDAVMADPDKRQMALADALNAIESLQRRFNHLEELAVVWQAAERVRRKAA